jgi:hypothetical protein
VVRVAHQRAQQEVPVVAVHMHQLLLALEHLVRVTLEEREEALVLVVEVAERAPLVGMVVHHKELLLEMVERVYP